MMHGNNVTTYPPQQNIGALNYDIAPKHHDGSFTGEPAPQISVPDHGVVWQYDAGSKQYFKSQNGRQLLNIGTGRVRAKTVIVEYVISFPDTYPANSLHGSFTEAYEL